MSQSIVEMTKDLVLAQIQSGALALEDMQEALRHIYQQLQRLKSREESEFPVAAPAAAAPQAPADWRTSIICRPMGPGALKYLGSTMNPK